MNGPCRLLAFLLVLTAALHAEKAEMFTRSYKVEPEFLPQSEGDGKLGKDPFGPQPVQNKPLKQLLEEAGITFPEGAAVFRGPLGEIVCRNTEENLERLRKHIEALNNANGKYQMEEKRPLTTRSFNVPSDFLSVGDADPLTPPADPFAANASPPAPEPTTKIPRRSARQVLEAAGITFPEGASAAFNPLTGLLKITNTQPNLDLVEAFFDSGCHLPTKNIAFALTLIEGPGELIRQINADASKTANASKQLTKLLDLAQKPGSSVRTAGAAFLETKSGTRATADTVCEPWFTNRKMADTRSDSSESPEMQPHGLRLALEPIVHADGQTVELSLDLELSPPVNEKPRAGTDDSSNDSPAPAPAPSISSAHFSSTLIMSDGSTRLIGITQKNGDILQAAFISTAIHYAEGTPHPFARGIPTTTKTPKGMASITFQIPPHLFESIMPSQPTPFREWLIEQGITFPPGALLEFQNGLLQMTNTEENIESIAVLIDCAVRKAPKNTTISLHTVRAPMAFLRKLSAAAMAASDQSESWKELEDAATRGDVIFLESSFFESKSGTRSTHGAGRECYFLDQRNGTDKSQPGISLGSQHIGSFFEFEPSLSADGRLMEISFTHDLHAATEAPNEVSPVERIEGQDFPLPRTGIRTLKTVSSTTMSNGDIKLIALHKDLSPEAPGYVWATFLRCNIVPQFFNPRRAVINRVTSAAHKDSQETIAYRVPADFFERINSLGTRSQQESDDPFAAGSVRTTHGNRRTHHPFERLGVTFPDGSSSSFNPKTFTLVVRNTPANHALIAAAIEKIFHSLPSSLAFTTHVVQAPGPLLRRLAAQASRKSDHRAELDELLAAAKVGTVLHLDTAHIETKPGTRATANQGRPHSSVGGISLSDKGEPVIKREIRHIGINLELEPTVHADGSTVELMLSSEFHTAPPFEHREHVIDTQGRRLEFPLTDYFTSKLTTRITIPDGSARLISLYKPTGKPSLKKRTSCRPSSSPATFCARKTSPDAPPQGRSRGSSRQALSASAHQPHPERQRHHHHPRRFGHG